MYEGYFTDYPDDEQISDEPLDTAKIMQEDEEEMKKAAHRKNVFERMVLEEVKDEHGEETAVIIEYYAAKTASGGFWNDPVLEGEKLSEELAGKVASRAVQNLNETQEVSESDRQHILNEAGLAE
jgi:hypothetical protein